MSGDILFDMETLGQSDAAVILSIAIFKFPEFDEDLSWSELRQCGVEWKLKINEQMTEHGRIQEPDTVRWWSEQGERAKQILSKDGRLPVETVLDNVEKFVRRYADKETIYWSRGLVDQRWSQHLFRSYGRECPIPWWGVRDTRTACHILLGDPKPVPKKLPDDIDFVAHSALDDCCMDYLRLKECFTQG